MATNLKKFKAIAAKKKLPPFMIVEGEDSYVLLNALAEIRKVIFPDSSNHEQADPLNEEHFDAKALGAKAANDTISSLKTLPMFAPAKLVLVRQAESLDSKSEQMLVQYIKDCQKEGSLGSSYLVLQYAKLRSNAKVKKFAEEAGLHIKQATDRRPDFEAAIKSIAEEKGVTLDNDTVRLIVEYLPRNLSLLERELEKLAVYAGDKGKLTAEDAAKLICSANLESVFQMTDAIGERKSGQALSILTRMLEQGEPVQVLVAMIARHMRHLYRIKQVAKARVSRQIVAKGLETHAPFVIEKANRHARNFSLDGLRQAVRIMYAVDRQLKSSSIPEDMVMQRTVLTLCRLPK